MELATVQKLKDAYSANYPSELLTPDLMPSLRLLSLVYSQPVALGPMEIQNVFSSS